MRSIAAILPVLLCAIAATSTGAGELAPPAGPVSPTMKTLDEVEPRIAVNTLAPGVDSVHLIDQPGSYYLTANITGQAGKHGVRIEADNVTLDLNGFAIEGVAGSDHGVNVSSVDGLTIRNGSISGFQSRGIEASTATSSVFESLIVRNNSDKGIAAGFDSIVRDCISNDNGSDGIFTNTGSLIERCVANDNSADGFDISVGCSIIDCLAVGNTGSGFFIIQHVNVDRCVARGNGQHGLVSGAGTSVLNSHFRRNSDHGIRVTTGCDIVNNRCDENSGPGIRVDSSCRVRDNMCKGNGFLTGDAAGILVDGAKNLIHANTASGNTRGVEITAIDNVVTSNVSIDNGANYVIVVGNDVAPISSAAFASSPLSNIED